MKRALTSQTADICSFSANRIEQNKKYFINFPPKRIKTYLNLQSN